MEDRKNTYLGVGWSFPPSFELNRVNMSEGLKSIEESIQVIITTIRGERVMRPSFGCDMEEHLFEYMDSTRLRLIENTIETSILLYEPRVDVEKIDVDTTEILEGKLMIVVTFKVRTTNSRHNIVFPYYFNEATNI